MIRYELDASKNFSRKSKTFTHGGGGRGDPAVGVVSDRANLGDGAANDGFVPSSSVEGTNYDNDNNSHLSGRRGPEPTSTTAPSTRVSAQSEYIRSIINDLKR